jgi:hypothetical protein
MHHNYIVNMVDVKNNNNGNQLIGSYCELVFSQGGVFMKAAALEQLRYESNKIDSRHRMSVW